VKRYRAFDLIIESAFDLPGAVEIETSLSLPDILIDPGNAALPNETASLAPYRLFGGAIEFTAARVGRYLIEAGSHITVEAEPGGDREMLTALLIATALPAALWMRGDMAIHACAVVPLGASGAIAVTAPSGGGKSTLLAAWAEAGAAVVADDVVRLSDADGIVTASGLPGGCFLPLPDSDDRHFLAFPPEQGIASAPLKALVRLDFAPGPSRLERLDTLAALQLLIAARHRPKVPTLLGKNGALLATCVLLARKVAMYRLTIERGGAPMIVDRLSGLATADTTES
jgi:hypothetical protein